MILNIFPNTFTGNKVFGEEFSLIDSKVRHSKLLSEINLNNINNSLKLEINPVNGNPITRIEKENLDNRKVFAVTINNHEKARPQYGLSQADMVMEVLAEGGITRYVGIFYGEEPEKIGPVRSVRRYMVDFIAEFNSPVILHEGGASFHGYENVYVRETDAIRDLVQYGMKSMQTAESRYRDPQKTASSGYVHALYTGSKLIEDDFNRIAKSRGWESTSVLETLKWKIDEPYENRGNGGRLDISFLLDSPYSNSGFEYDKESNSYKRIITGKPDIDLLTSEQISPKNVVVEWHKYRLANDGYSRIILDMIGSGEAQIYRDGKLINATWKKPDRESRTRYYDSEGEEIELVRGQTWKVVGVIYGNQKFSTITYKEYNN